MAMSPEARDLKVLVDFDWTLFDTTAFAQDLWAIVAEESGVPVETITEDSKKFHVDAVRGGYMYEDHMASYGLDADRMWERLDVMLQTHDYLYPDSADFIASLYADGFEPSILSFGERRFQEAKVMPFLGSLMAKTEGQTDMRVEVILEKKGTYIARTYPGQQGVLTDDVAEQELPEGFTEIHLDRAQGLPEPQKKPEGFVVSDLNQAASVIRSL